MVRSKEKKTTALSSLLAVNLRLTFGVPHDARNACLQLLLAVQVPDRNPTNLCRALSATCLENMWCLEPTAVKVSGQGRLCGLQAAVSCCRQNQEAAGRDDGKAKGEPQKHMQAKSLPHCSKVFIKLCTAGHCQGKAGWHCEHGFQPHSLNEHLLRSWQVNHLLDVCPKLSDGIATVRERHQCGRNTDWQLGTSQQDQHLAVRLLCLGHLIPGL